jgi:hypothetical protein
MTKIIQRQTANCTLKVFTNNQSDSIFIRFGSGEHNRTLNQNFSQINTFEFGYTYEKTGMYRLDTIWINQNLTASSFITVQNCNLHHYVSF